MDRFFRCTTLCISFLLVLTLVPSWQTPKASTSAQASTVRPAGGFPCPPISRQLERASAGGVSGAASHGTDSIGETHVFSIVPTSATPQMTTTPQVTATPGSDPDLFADSPEPGREISWPGA